MTEMGQADSAGSALLTKQREPKYIYIKKHSF